MADRTDGCLGVAASSECVLQSCVGGLVAYRPAPRDVGQVVLRVHDVQQQTAGSPGRTTDTSRPGRSNAAVQRFQLGDDDAAIAGRYYYSGRTLQVRPRATASCRDNPKTTGVCTTRHAVYWPVSPYYTASVLNWLRRRKVHQPLRRRPLYYQ